MKIKNLKKMENKKAVSEMVAYVLLVVISISLAIIVYAWLSKYIRVTPTPECPDSVALSVEDYVCYDDNQTLLLRVKNKGFFNISGYDIWGTSNTSKEALTSLRYEVSASGMPKGRYYFEIFSKSPTFGNGTLGPGRIDSKIHLFYYDDFPTNHLEKIKIQPFVVIKDREAMCDKAIIVMEVGCLSGGTTGSLKGFEEICSGDAECGSGCCNSGVCDKSSC